MTSQMAAVHGGALGVRSCQLLPRSGVNQMPLPTAQQCAASRQRSPARYAGSGCEGGTVAVDQVAPPSALARTEATRVCGFSPIARQSVASGHRITTIGVAAGAGTADQWTPSPLRNRMAATASGDCPPATHVVSPGQAIEVTSPAPGSVDPVQVWARSVVEA